MAMRLLLFNQSRLNSDQTDYKMIEEELLRLEKAFGELTDDPSIKIV